MAEIKPIFAAPMYWDFYPNSLLNKQLRTVILERSLQPANANPNPYTIRNEALFESHFDLFKWTDAPIQELKNYCLNSILKNVQTINQYSDEYMKRMQVGCDSWFHVTKNGGYFGIHNHPMASWSGVYCVSDGEPEGDDPSNGALTFINPFISTNMFVDAGNAQMQGIYSTQSMMFSLKPGQLVLFPSWMLHEVKRFQGRSERITVAFNCWFSLTNAFTQ